MSSRRNFLKNIATFGAGAVASAKAFASEHSGMQHNMPMQHGAQKAAGRSRMARIVAHPLLVETPDVPQLPWRIDGGVKEFHLVAELVKRRLIPGREMAVWGYNGSCPGPTIQVNQGDRVRIIFENHLPESSTIHWHGLEVPLEMDGLPFQSETNSARRQVCLRVHVAPGGNVLLPRSRGNAGDDGHDRLVHHP